MEQPLDALSMTAPILLSVPVTLGGSEFGTLSTLDLLLSSWVLGSIWCVVRIVRRSFILRRCLRSARPVDATLERMVEREAERIGVKKPTVLSLSWIQSHFLFGLRNPVLVWPETGDAIVASARSSVILHELAHLKRRDPLTSCLEVAARSLLWWNPLVWYAVAQSRRFKELACDAWVMAEQPEERNLYASALIQAIDLRTPSVLAGSSHGWIGSGSRIRERIRARRVRALERPERGLCHAALHEADADRLTRRNRHGSERSAHSRNLDEQSHPRPGPSRRSGRRHSRRKDPHSAEQRWGQRRDSMSTTT